jgi:GH25 family lysozyme M1 (1,4-beta-N-acetylmuramidase)
MLRRAAVALTALTALATATPSLAAISGADVSKYQHPNGAGINWSAVRASGHAFVFHKATDGLVKVDPTFARDWSDAKRVGLYVGAYHYARPAAGAANADAQARHLVAVAGTTRHAGELPLVLDLESSGGLTPAQLISWTHVFLSTVQRITGRTPMVYSYPSFWKTAMAGTRAFRAYPLWAAQYRCYPTTFDGAWDRWTFWQYSSSSTVSGVPAVSDMNRFNGTLAQLRALTWGNGKVETTLSATGPGSVAAGAVVPLTGALRTAGGRPVGGRQVTLLARRAGTATWVLKTRTTTTATGAWRALVRTPYDTQLIARFTGDRAAMPSTSGVVSLHVPPAS